MGTRHRQAVITKDGELKIQQYGQWDGYPGGQGLGILKYLKSGNLQKYQKNLANISQITDSQVEEIEKDSDWHGKHPYLSRDCGAKIHQMIEDGIVPFVMHASEEECRSWCEGFYTIDFEKGLFITECHDRTVELPLDKLPDNEGYLSLFTEI